MIEYIGIDRSMLVFFYPFEVKGLKPHHIRMLFNSIQFAIFYIVTTFLYYALPHRFRWFLLLAASCYFYMAFVPIYILILGFTIIVDYLSALAIEGLAGKGKKWLLLASLAANIGVLAVFKYYNFFIGNVSGLLEGLGFRHNLPYLSILLPIGLSFHTFQSMSYVIEVYRGNQKAERHFGIYALYVMFYPQLVAGPIERPQNLLHQFHEEKKFDYSGFASGLKLMAWGLFKKVVIADRLAAIVDKVYDNPHDYRGFSFLVATVLFSFQIFCDFSGYSDIAIGAARTLGFKLMKNFDRPYSSTSIQEFWKRWHISLSTWFRDYLYIPLGGNRVNRVRRSLNLFLVFLVSGLWHGASWTYVIWGALHGLFMIVSVNAKGRRASVASLPDNTLGSRLNRAGKMVATFSLVTLAWVFFRAKSVSDACYIILQIFISLKSEIITILHHAAGKSIIRESAPQLAIGLAAIALMQGLYRLKSKIDLAGLPIAKHPALRWAFYFAVVGLIFYFGEFGDRQFIYFQF